MQVERILRENLLLISSFFTLLKLEITTAITITQTIVLRIFVIYLTRLQVTQLKTSVPLPRTIAKEPKRRLGKAFVLTTTVSVSAMALNAEAKEHLAAPKTPEIESALLPDKDNGDIVYNNIKSDHKNSTQASTKHMNWRCSTDSKTDHKRKKFSIAKSINNISVKSSSSSCNSNDDDLANPIEHKNSAYIHSLEPYRRTYDGDSLMMELNNKNIDNCAKNSDSAILSSSSDHFMHANITESVKDSTKDSHPNPNPDCTDYIAPEQALVTSVELVMPASVIPTSDAMSSVEAAESCIISTTHFSNNKLSYKTDVIFNDKTEGCATDSPTSPSVAANDLNVRRLSDNLALTTTTGDILTLDRGLATSTTTAAAVTTTTIWAPHGEYKDIQNTHHGPIKESRLSHHNIHSGLGAYQSDEDVYAKQERLHLITGTGGQLVSHVDIYRSHNQHQEQQLHHHHQAPQKDTHPAELILQIEAKDALGVGIGFGQMIPTLQHHQQHPHSHQYHNQVHQSFEQQQQRQDHQLPLPNNMYAEILHQQQHTQQQQPLQQQNHYHSFHEQSMQYANYNQHYSPHGQQIFGIQHPHPNQSHQERQQLHHQEEPQQQQLQETYQDLMMDEFHEDPSSAYKLTLSPNIAKPENHDDGYETSAGDVLTPNSHSSSIHSITPLHQMHYGNKLGHVSHKKQDELGVSHTQIRNQTAAPSTSFNTQGENTSGLDAAAPLPTHQLSQRDGDNNGDSVAVTLSNKPYSFIGDEMTPIQSHATASATLNDPSYSHKVATGESASGSSPSVVGSESSVNTKQLPHQHVGTREPFASDSYELDTSLQSQDADNGSSCILKANSAATDPIAPKRRGRKKKIMASATVGNNMHVTAAAAHSAGIDVMSTNILTSMKPKERKKHDRFNGMSEAEVIKRTIPDHLCDNLDIVIVGINPGLFAAYKGHHYAGPGNHFWKCLYLSGLTQEQMCSDDDHTLLKHGIGFTNMVARATKGSADLTRKEIKEGSRILLDKLQRYRPKVAVFNGKLIFEVFSGKKEFHFGRQPDRVDGTDTYVWVMPSSSARCAQLPRAADKVPFYAALKKFRDFLNGKIQHMDDSECVFTEQRIRQCCELQQGQPLKLNPNASGQHHYIEQHVDQNSNHMFADNIAAVNEGNGKNDAGRGECGGSIQYSNQLPSVVATDGFIYGNDQALRNLSSSLGAEQQNYLAILSNQPPPEKKKRGRPKKIKDQDMAVFGNGGTKMPVANQLHNFNNILNVSIIEATGGSTSKSSGNSNNGIIVNGGSNNNDSPAKKKRGRPKKLKPTIENVITAVKSQNANQLNPEAQTVLGPKSGSCSGLSGGMSTMHTISIEHSTASPQGSHQAPPSLYNTPPPSHMLYTASASPMASPALNCSSYSHSHGTPPVVDSHKSQVLTATSIRDQQPHLGETPPPSSPNLCTVVDFEPPNEQCNDGHDATLANLPIASRETIDVIAAHQQGQPEHYQWLSPNHHHQQPAPKPIQVTAQSAPDAVAAQYSQPSTIGVSLRYQSESQSTEQPDWHSYDTNRSYIIDSPQNQHHQQQQDQHQNLNLSVQLSNNQSQFAADVARKSLSGLESLVDQIPPISEHETTAISAATAAAATAAVESRLLGLQHQQQQLNRDHAEREEPPSQSQSQTGNENNSNDSNAISNNFSVNSLAASSATSLESHLINNTIHNPMRSESGTNVSMSININNSGSNSRNGGYPCHSSASYPHSHANHLISAALAAATQQPSTQHPMPLTHAHTHPHSHTQMYVDHAHITSMYASPYGPQHGTTTSSDYGSHVTPYGTITTASSQTLHVPSHNYTYAHYGHTTTPQTQYPGFTHVHPHVHPHAHHHHAHPHPHHGHAAHHLSVFERLKPSDISGYSGF